MCKVIIFDNYPLFSFGLSSILKASEGIEILCEARKTGQVKAFLDKFNPDVIIINLLHLDNGGLRPIKQIRRQFHKTPVLLILSEFHRTYFEEYIRLGVNGFIFDDASPEELTSAVKKLSKGLDFFQDKVWLLLKEMLRSHKSIYTEKNDTTLSDREITIIKHFGQGLTYKEIAHKLNISTRTVESHKKNILTKLRLKTTIEMVKFAMANNLIS